MWPAEKLGELGHLEPTFDSQRRIELSTRMGNEGRKARCRYADEQDRLPIGERVREAELRFSPPSRGIEVDIEEHTGPRGRHAKHIETAFGFCVCGQPTRLIRKDGRPGRREAPVVSVGRDVYDQPFVSITVFFFAILVCSVL